MDTHPQDFSDNPAYSNHSAEQIAGLKEESDEKERKARVNAAWEQMNSRLPSKPLKSPVNKSSPSVNKPAQKRVPEWMVALGFSPAKKPCSNNKSVPEKKSKSIDSQNDASEESKRLAAAALSAVKDVASMAATSKGKIEISEVRDFAGENIEVKKLVDADSKEAAERAKAAASPSSALDNILEQIKKKQKLSVLDKTKKDWGEYKEENKGLEDELDAYKKSSNKYLDKVSFLQRTDLREFERERDARLALQAKRRTETREQEF